MINMVTIPPGWKVRFVDFGDGDKFVIAIHPDGRPRVMALDKIITPFENWRVL